MQLLQDAVGSEGGAETWCNPPVSVTNRFTSTDRKKMYTQGGCYLVTARILVVDLLTHNIDIGAITGVIVDKAHKCTDNSQEAFILNILQCSSKFKGFVKGVSERPEVLSSKFGLLAQVMKNLGVKQVYLWPRFHVNVKNYLQRTNLMIYEVAQPLTEKMNSIQTCIVQALELCLKELRHTQNIDTSSLTVENSLYRSFDVTLRKQLDSVWHKVGNKTKLLLKDIGVVRRLFDELLRLNGIAFYELLLTIKNQIAADEQSALWLLTDAADKMFDIAKSRVFTTKIKKTKEKNKGLHVFDMNCGNTIVLDKAQNRVFLNVRAEEDEKAHLLCSVLSDIEKESEWKRDIPGGCDIVIFCKNELTCRHLNNVLASALSSTGLNLDREFSQFVAKRFRSWCDLHSVSINLEDELDYYLLLNVLWNPEVAKQQSEAASTRLKLNEISFLSVEQRLLFSEHIRRELNTAKLESTPIYKFSLASESDRNRILIQSTMDGDDQLLDQCRPQYVIIYDPDVKTVRQVEVYQAQNPTFHVHLYVLQYKESSEEQRYLSDLKREQDSFRKLIDEKAGLVIPKTNFENHATYMEDKGNTVVGYNLSTGEALLGNDLKRRKRGPFLPSVIVDMREFRSALPSMLHHQGIKVEPTTLEVGDYVLSPEIVVERKSIPDLFGSFNSGRLYTQAEAMCRWYKRSHLLIEFDETKPFSLVAAAGDSLQSHASIIAKLVLLTLHFPSLKLLWSPNPRSTVDLFKLMKANYNNPDSAAAASVGVPQETRDARDTNSNVVETHSENLTAHELLRRLPGINIHNYPRVISQVKSLRELSSMSEQQMTGIIGAQNGKLLYNFFNADPIQTI